MADHQTSAILERPSGDGEAHTHAHRPAAPPPPTPRHDPAAQSLGDALRVSFFLLKLAMVVLVVVYLFSGVFRVPENSVGVKLRFGKIVGTAQQGLNFNWPFPIGDKIIVPTTERTVSLNQEYWYDVEDRAGAGPLDPLRDGSLITGDANLVHGRFDVTYSVLPTQVDRFVANVGLAEIGEKLLGGNSVMLPTQAMARADQVVKKVAEHAVLRAVASLDADAFIAGTMPREQATAQMNRVLDELGTGLQVRRLDVTQRSMPVDVADAYQAVVNAQSERAQRIEEAQQERARTLGSAAGQAAPNLSELIDQYELALTANQPEEAARLLATINQSLAELRLPEELGGHVIGGDAAGVMNEAQAFRTQVVQEMRAKRDAFGRALATYRENPQLFEGREAQRAREAILGGENTGNETFYAPPGQLYLEMGRDPELARQREERRLQEAQQAARERSQQQNRQR